MDVVLKSSLLLHMQSSVLVVVPKALFTECILRVVGLLRYSDLAEQHCQYKSHVGQQIYVLNMKNSKLKDVEEI